MFRSVDAKPDFPKQEEQTLKYWEQNKVFEKSIEQRDEDSAYTFYDGPPFITGYPHYGNLLVSIAKDIVPRFFTMKGKRVRRVWGWDCHGLPIENKVEVKLGLKNRRDITDFGINNFIGECQKYVEKVSSEWKWYVDHIGRWVDFSNAYRTMDLDYMESVIWVFKQLYDKGLIYKGVRTSLYCTRCGTPISNFEIAMDNCYKEMEDPGITVKFKTQLQDKEVNLLAWTTTPWTLPSNRALVVDNKENYVLVTISGDQEQYVIAEKRVESVLSGYDYKVVDIFTGKELVGLGYQSPYNYFPPNDKDYKIYTYQEMVNMDEGTGIVHSAPGFGDIDTEMGKDLGLSIMFSVDEEGKFVGEVDKWAGVYVKEADPLIIRDLRERNLLFREDTVVHRYPYCYRCETPLIHRAQDSWFINVQDLKKKLLKSNESINWVPEHFKYGRFKKGVELAPDWCISRTRYWATAMPVWECGNCGKRVVAGSIKEIEELSGQRVNNLHRNGLDHITFECSQCRGEMKRVSEVLDCWMESGSMPYAERHYPFENKEEFDKSFPADFIVEYTGQVRAWFYVMHVVSNALYNTHCFKNVVVTGVMKGTDGRKMSKSYGNYPDPRVTIEKYGGDALRLYLMSSPVMMGREVNMTHGEEIEAKVKTVSLILWNSYRYFVTYANIFKLTAEQLNNLVVDQLGSFSALDRWVISQLYRFIRDFEKAMEEYNIPGAVNLIQPFVNNLSTWYIRRSRDRFLAGEEAAFKILHHVLKQSILAIAPAMPFLTEEIYQNLRLDSEPESIHLCDWPKVEDDLIDEELVQKMETVRVIVEQGHSARREAGVKVRQPLPKITVICHKDDQVDGELLELVKDELNIKEVQFELDGDRDAGIEIALDIRMSDNLILEGMARDIIRAIQDLRKNTGYQRSAKIEVYWISDSSRVRDVFSVHGTEIGERVLARRISNERKEKVDQETTIKLQDEEVWVGVCLD
ncbi:isoleucine--tRNA ligase [Patescibacteria group bacterium]|nr:isoleucine--tRNA ligase [Patescibacteria group bacterium]MBU1868245.1 isoleucine--tRNA ligase [Patescibacteria group bacterium]